LPNEPLLDKTGYRLDIIRKKIDLLFNGSAKSR
jgi:hypothetical protein